MSRKVGMKVLTLGVWDLFHSGHVNLFKICRKIAGEDGEVWVTVNTDEFTTKYKTKPVMNLEERLAVVSACKYVDHAIVNEWDNHCYPIFKKIKPDFVVHGDDWTGEGYHDQIGVSKEQFDKLGTTLVYCEYTKGVSSTDVRNRLIKVK